MKLYIASSWKNESEVNEIAAILRRAGHEVDAFCDPSTGRMVMDYSSLGNMTELTIASALDEPLVQMAFQEDKKWIDWSDGVLLVLPSGRSAHLEAGYAKGQGKILMVYQDQFSKGELDVMYGFSDLVTSDFAKVLTFLDTHSHSAREMVSNGTQK